MEKATLFVLLIFPTQLMCLWVAYRAGKMKEREGWNTVMNQYKQTIIEQTHTIAGLQDRIAKMRPRRVSMNRGSEMEGTEQVHCVRCGKIQIIPEIVCVECQEMNRVAEEV